MHKALYVFAIVTFIFSIYVLYRGYPLKGPVPIYDYEKEDNVRLGKITPHSCSVSGTVLDVTGQIVTVQGDDSPCTISLVFVNGDLPTGLAPGKTVIMSGEFKKGLFVTDHITITGVTPWTASDPSPQSLGLIDHMMFFIAYWLL